MVFASRDLPKEPHEAHDNSQKDPEWLLEMKKKHKNWNKKTPWFEANLATLAAKIDIQEDTKNGTTSDTPFPHISGVQIMPRQKINERGEKTAFPGIILSKRKGGIGLICLIIRPSKALYGPYQALSLPFFWRV